MRRLTSMAVALILAGVSVGMFAGLLSAQTGSRVYEACERARTEIRAGALPAAVDLGRCPIAGRQVVDHGIRVFVPAPGYGVHAEAYGPGGSQELAVTHRKDGILEIKHPGSELEGVSGGGQWGEDSRASRASGACSDSAYVNLPYKIRHYLRYSFNVGSTPYELGKKAAEGAIIGGGANVAAVRNDCGLGDNVPARLIYEGATRTGVNMGTGASCTGSDNKSVIGFGTLPSNYTAAYCMITAQQSGYDRPTESDVRINKAYYTWTTNPLAPSCRGRYDLESTVTHERGHTFGLGHVSESYHGVLTMSPVTEGPCQVSERTLGRGDVIGLNNKYR